MIRPSLGNVRDVASHKVTVFTRGGPAFGDEDAYVEKRALHGRCGRGFNTTAASRANFIFNLSADTRRAARGVAGSRGAAATTVAMVWLSAQGCGSPAESRSAGKATSQDAALVLREVNLGVIPRSGGRAIVARLANPTSRTVEWSAFRTSCDCVSVIADRNVLRPNDDVLAMVSFDGRERPSFVGNLAIEVTAVDSNDAKAFRFDVLAEVVPEDELAFCNGCTQD